MPPRPIVPLETLDLAQVLYDRDGSGIAEANPGDIEWTAALAGIDTLHVTGIELAEFTGKQMGFFDLPVDQLPARPIMAAYCKQAGFGGEQTVVVTSGRRLAGARPSEAPAGARSSEAPAGALTLDRF